MQPQARPLPNAAVLASMNIDELMSATTRMSHLLQQESELLAALRFKELPKLHEEKMKLTVVLESYQQLIAADPSMVKNADPKVREQLLLKTDDLAFNMEDNFRKVSVARAVNSRVMQAIMDVMSEQHRPAAYGRNGMANAQTDLAISVNLNQKA